MWWREFRPYVPVAKRQANANAHAKNLAAKEKRVMQPVVLLGGKIAKTFWGKAWCDNLEAYSDFSNRLPRGRSYVRNGSVIDLVIEEGRIKALVSGSYVYKVEIDIDTLPKRAWDKVKADCSNSVTSVLDLLAGRFDREVMERLTRRDDGLFPKPKEIHLKCSCPDYATMCKHVCAVLYGVGNRLDSAPELLFTLRGVDQSELIGQAVSAENLDKSLHDHGGTVAPAGDLGELFGIDFVATPAAEKPAVTTKPKAKPEKPATARRPAKPVKKAPAKMKPKPR